MYFNCNNCLTPKSIEIFNFIKFILITVHIAIIVCIYTLCTASSKYFFIQLTFLPDFIHLNPVYLEDLVQYMLQCV